MSKLLDLKAKLAAREPVLSTTIANLTWTGIIQKAAAFNFDMMMFDLEHIICELSEGMTLKSGSIIVTGTPAGVGMGFNPPKFLKSGDTMECTIEKIGTLINIIQ